MDMSVDMDIYMEMDTGTIFCFSSNRNKPKLDLLWSRFGLFRETKKMFGLFRCFGTVSKQAETKNRRFKTNQT
jgi:hypothetical protein